MSRKNVPLEEIYDATAVRVLVEKKDECYDVLSMVHSLWKPVPAEFDDYINNPKTNGYQSLHTAVEGPEERVFEVEETMSNGCQSLRMRRCDHGFRMVALNKHFGANFIRPGIMEYYENFKDKGVQRILIKARISPLGYSFPREAQMPPTLQKPGDYMIIKDK